MQQFGVLGEVFRIPVVQDARGVALERAVELLGLLVEALAGQEGVGNLPSGFLGRFVDSTANALADMAKKGRDPVLVTRATLRPFLAEAIAGVIPNAAVLSYQETAPAKRIETTQRIAVAASA